MNSVPLPPAIPLPSAPLPPNIALDDLRLNLPAYTPPVAPLQVDAPLPAIEPPSQEQQQENKKPAAAAATLAPPAIRVQLPQIETLAPEPSSAESDDVLPPTDRQTQQGTAETTSVTIPGTDIQIPVPRAEILSAAATTSVISVVATLAATGIFKRLVSLMKPVITQVWKLIQRKRGKSTLTWARARRQRKAHKAGSTD
jgi:hypothetical protein